MGQNYPEQVQSEIHTFGDIGENALHGFTTLTNAKVAMSQMAEFHDAPLSQYCVVKLTSPIGDLLGVDLNKGEIAFSSAFLSEVEYKAAYAAN